MAYIPVSDSPSAFVFGTGSILLDFNGTYLQLDGGNEDVSFVRHIRKLGGVIVSAPTIGGLSSALQHNLSAAVPIIGVMPTVKSGGEPDSLKDVAQRLAAKTAEHGLPTTVAKFTPKFEPILLNMTLASGRIELFVLDGGKKESIEALERTVNTGDEAAVAKAAEAHGLILVVVWFAAKESEPIKRILYTGNASPSRVIAALEKAESLSLLCVKTATPAQAAKGIALPARVKVRPSQGSASRPPAAASTTRTSTATRPAPTAARTGTGRPPVAKPTTTTSRPSLGSRPAAPSATRPAATPRTAASSGRLGSASSTSSGPRTPATSRGGATASTKPKEAAAQRKTVGTSQGAALSRAGASAQRASASPAKPQRGAAAPTTPRAAKTAPAKAPAPAAQAPPTVVPPVVVLDEVVDAAGTPAVDVVVIPPTPEPSVAEPRADQQEPAVHEPQPPVQEEPAAPEPTPEAVAPEAPAEPEAPAAPQYDASRADDASRDEDAPRADGIDDSVIFVADVFAPAPVPSQTADDSAVFIAEVPAPVPLVIPEVPAAEAVAPFEPQPVAEPAPAEPTGPTDSTGEGATMGTVAPGFKEPIAPQPVGASGLLDEVEEPSRLRKISMDTYDLEKALKGIDLEGTEAGAGSSSHVGGVESETMPTLQAESAAETARKISEHLIAEAATPFTSALASTIGNSGEAPTAVDQLIDMVSDVTGPVQEAAQAVAADSNKQHPTMQTRSSLVANDDGGERPMEFEQTDPAIDTVLDAVAAASEELDRSMENGLDTQNGPAKENEKEDDGEWTEVRPFESTNGPMFVPVSRTAAKPRLTRERYFELVTVPHKAGKCTLESLEEATDFFAAVRSSCYILATEDVAAFVLDGWLAGRKLWNSAGDLSSCLVPTVHHPNLTAFTAANGAELDELHLSVRTAIPNSVMTINTEDGPEDYHLSKITL